MNERDGEMTVDGDASGTAERTDAGASRIGDPAPPAPETLIPLPRLAFHILLALAPGARHGYAIAKEVERNTRGRTKPSTGSLYLSMERLQKQGLIAETEERPEPGRDDRRRRYFGITELGRRVARAEGERLLRLVELAAARDLLGKASTARLSTSETAESGG